MDIISGFLEACFNSVFQFSCAFANDNLGSKDDVPIEATETESSTDDVDLLDSETPPETAN